MDTEIFVILDRSWSMNTIQADTISGFNDWLKETAKGQKQGDDVRITVTIFDTEVEQTVVRVPLRACPKLGTEANPFVPRGNTALLDALGSTLVKARRAVSKGKRGLAVIITDGGENSSVEWKKPEVSKLIDQLTETDRWSFVYLGAGIDAFDQARSVSLRASVGQTVSYGRAETHSAYTANAGVTRAFLASNEAQSTVLGSQTAQAMGQTVEAPPEDKRKPKPRAKSAIKLPKASK